MKRKKDIATSAAATKGGDVVLVFDTELRRPACVLLQAAHGCGHSNGLLQMLFDVGTWLVAPTKGMRRIAGTREQWARLAAAVNAKNARSAKPRHRSI